MEARDLRTMTEAEYLAMETASDEKHEYVRGEVFAMAGGTPAHALVTMNVAGSLRNALRDGPCVVLSSDARIRTDTTDAYFYPDVTVVCGPAERHARDRSSLVTPTLLVEVLSPSTAGVDRGIKLSHYRRIPSVQAIVMVSIEHRRVELWTRAGDEWIVRDVEGEGACVTIATPSVELPLADIFENVERFEDDRAE